METNELTLTKETYAKPQLTIIKLFTDEVMVVGCKTNLTNPTQGLPSCGQGTVPCSYTCGS